MNKFNRRRVFARLATFAAALAVFGCSNSGSVNPTTSGNSGVSSTGATASASSGGASGASSGASSTSSTSGAPPVTVATEVFNYPSDFSGSNLAQTSAEGDAGISIVGGMQNGTQIDLTTTARGAHQSGGAWYWPQLDITAFTTDFTFQLNHTAYGMFFCIQNTDASNDANPYGVGDRAAADANGEGYGAYQGLSSQFPLVASIGIKFDQSGFNGNSVLTESDAGPSGTGLYMNGGPSMFQGFSPEDDLRPYGLNLNSNDVFAAHIVYDGTYLVMTLQDTQTNAQMRKMWPVNIAAMVGADKAWVGFTGGLVTPVVDEAVLSWDFYEGYATRLATPQISVPAGQYSTAQTVSITGPTGATIYYTTNGQLPTSASTRYTGPIQVSATELLQAVAIQSGFTDSYVASASYQIAPSATPVINFEGGFAGASSLLALNGVAAINGGTLQMTDTTYYAEAATAWYVAPVNVDSFQTQFTLSFPGNPMANGLCFAIQNQLPAADDIGGKPAWGGNLVVSGGINTLGLSNSGLGYQGILSSLCVDFDLYDGSGDTTGLVLDGTAPDAGTDMTSSGVSLHSGHPLKVALSYSNMTLALNVTDTVSEAQFNTSWNIDIPAIVGGDTAYVGFTAATGGQTATQQITTWTFSN